MSGYVASPVGRCRECGKWIHLNRADAKAYARRWNPGQSMSAYISCDGTGFHLGHRSRRLPQIREQRRSAS